MHDALQRKKRLPAKAEVAIQCARCGETRPTVASAGGLSRLPKGWKRIEISDEQEATICNGCWNQQFMLRSVTIPISGPVGRDWSELRAALDACWSASTELSNWVILEMAKADVVRVPEMGKRMPAMPHVYLYPEARRRFPMLDSKSLCAVLNAAQGRYRKARLATIWLNRERLPRYQYPTPYPVKAEAWSVQRGEGGEWLLRLRLAGQSWTLKLRGGHQFRRQLSALTQLLDGKAHACEAAIYRVRADGSHHATSTGRRAGGGHKTPMGVMAKLVLWLPRPVSPRIRSGMLSIRTSSEALLSAFDADGNRIASFFADHVPRQVAEHRRALQRLKADMAVARATSPGQLKQLAEHRDRLCDRQGHRLNSVCHQAAAFVAGLAQRKAVAEVRYDDSEHGYVESFPWYQLRRMVGEKLDALGIPLVLAAEGPDSDCSDETPQRMPAPLDHPPHGGTLEVKPSNAG